MAPPCSKPICSPRFAQCAGCWGPPGGAAQPCRTRRRPPAFCQSLVIWPASSANNIQRPVRIGSAATTDYRLHYTEVISSSSSHSARPPGPNVSSVRICQIHYFYYITYYVAALSFMIYCEIGLISHTETEELNILIPDLTQILSQGREKWKLAASKILNPRFWIFNLEFHSSEVLDICIEGIYLKFKLHIPLW